MNTPTTDDIMNTIHPLSLDVRVEILMVILTILDRRGALSPADKRLLAELKANK